MIRVLISANSPLTASRLINQLRSHGQIDAWAESAYEDSLPFGAISHERADVVLAVVEHAGEISGIAERFEGVAPLLILAGDDLVEYGVSNPPGVRAVLPAELSESRLTAAIEAVAAGLGVFLPNEEIDAAPASSVAIPMRNLVEPLTPREVEILRAMADGLGNKEIASRFGISENTVKFHVGSVMGKLGASSRTEAVMQGIRHGIVLIQEIGPLSTGENELVSVYKYRQKQRLILYCALSG